MLLRHVVFILTVPQACRDTIEHSAALDFRPFMSAHLKFVLVVAFVAIVGANLAANRMGIHAPPAAPAPESAGPHLIPPPAGTH
jgi:hypothetical protein